MEAIGDILKPLLEELERQMKSCGSLWKKTSGNGNNMLSGFIDLGALGKVNIMVFPNQKKEGEKQPDFFVAVNDGTGEQPGKEAKADPFA